jgi:hypothetical protein
MPMQLSSEQSCLLFFTVDFERLGARSCPQWGQNFAHSGVGWRQLSQVSEGKGAPHSSQVRFMILLGSKIDWVKR